MITFYGSSVAAGRRFRGVLTLVAVLLLGACGQSRPIGGPSAAPPPSRPSVSSSQAPPSGSSAALGDLASLDPCSLIAPDAVYRFGAAAQGRPVSLDYCVTTIETPSGAHLEIATGELRKVDPANDLAGRAIVPVGPWQLVQNPLQQGECTRDLVFTDGIAMNVRVDLFAGDTTLDLCAIAETAVRAAASTILHGAVRHRDDPPASLGRLDPCQQLPVAVLQQLPDLAGHSPVGAPGKHQCSWGSEDPSQARVRLLYGAGDPPAVHDNTADLETIVGRKTVLTRIGGGGGPALCTVETSQLPYGPAAANAVEVATVVVVLPSGDMNQSCADGRAVATAVWPALPAV